MDFVSFDDLFRLERVNKRVCDVVMNVAWPKIHTINHESIIKFTDYPIIPKSYIHIKEPERHNLNNKSVKLLLYRTTNLKHLDLSFYWDKITSQIISHLYKNPQLISLNLSRVSLTNDNLKAIANSCPMLEKLYLLKCFKAEFEDGLKFLFNRCPNISNLDLGSNDDLLGASFAYIPTKFKYMNISDCKNLTSTAMNVLADRATNLETLIIDNFSPKSDVNVWLRKLTKLRCLKFDGTYSDRCPPLNLSYLKELEMLSLTRNSLVTLETLESLKKCPKLKGFDCGFFNDHGNSLEIFKQYKALKYCGLNFWNEKMNDNLVDFVQTSKIEYLSLNDCNFLSYNLLKLLITECNSLSVLEVFCSYPEVINEDYNRMFASILSKENETRSNLLKLIIPQDIQKFPPLKFCEIIPAREYMLSYPSTYQLISKAIEENKIDL